MLSFDSAVTKLNVLSYIARTFDPLGFISPVTFRFKRFLQLLWLSKIGWDVTLPSHLIESWNNFASQLVSLRTLVIPRHISSPHLSYNILGFCEASEKGFAAAIYLHIELEERIEVNLLKAKSRVAPVKPTTILRLELCSDLLLAQLYKSVLTSLSEVNILHNRMHTDAQIVLAWLNTPLTASRHLLPTG